MSLTAFGGAPGSRHRWHYCLLMSLGLSAQAAYADSPFEDRFTLDFGSYFMTSQTGVRVDGFEEIELGTRLDLEDVFSLQDETVFRLEGAWRFKPRHAMRLMYFDSSRTRTNAIDREIDFGDETYPLGADVTVKFKFTVLELAYQYSLMKSENFELGASVGVHNIKFKIGLDAMLEGGPANGGVQAEETASTNAPLPVVGLGATWHMANDVYLLAHAQYFQVKTGGLDGSLEDYQAGVLWQFNPHFGVGAAYNMFRLNVDANDADDFRGQLDWKYYGPQLFMRAAF